MTIPFQTLFYLLNYTQANFQSDSGNLRWAVVAGMEQSCNFLLYMIKWERQDTTYIEFIVKLLQEDGPKEGKGST